MAENEKTEKTNLRSRQENPLDTFTDIKVHVSYRSHFAIVS